MTAINRLSKCKFSSAALLLLAAGSGPGQAQSTCAQHLLVSGYFSNNVAIFDACNGQFLRQLDSSNRIRGPQAARLGPDGLIYLISEGNDSILRYRASDYEFVDVFRQLSSAFDPTGLEFGRNGELFVASYGTDAVSRINLQDPTMSSILVPPGSGVDGPDNGMGMGPDGMLYVPGYDSDNVARVNPDNGQVQANFVAPRTGGLNETRGILFEPDGQTFLVGGEGSGAIYRFRLSDGALVQTLISGLGRPTGLALAADGALLVLAEPEKVYRYDRSSGARLDVLVDAAAAGIVGGTFLALLPNPQAATVDGSQIGTQYWVFGSGLAQARSLSADMVSATGSVFGAQFNPADVVRKRWGSIQLQFSACDRAMFSYDSSGANSANFGSLSYEVVRLVDTEATLACRAQGFAQVSGNGWMSGAWYGVDRSGEGLVIDVAADGIAVASFYTHLPEGF